MRYTTGGKVVRNKRICSRGFGTFTQAQCTAYSALDYGQAPEAVISASQKFRVGNYLPMIKQFVAELTRRLSSYEMLCERFGFMGRLIMHNRRD